ncbi:MAG: class I SAM-dependent methyltransferase [Actinomycetota bacterium]
MTRPDWWLDEQLHAGAEHLDPSYVAGYDAKSQVDPTPDIDALVALGLGEGSTVVDIVHTRNALHQIPDFWKVIALQRIHDVLGPGGILRLRDLVFDLEPDAIGEGIDEWKAGAVDDPPRGYTAPEFAEHVRAEHSTFTWLLEPALERVGFDIVDREVGRNVCAAYTCRRR